MTYRLASQIDDPEYEDATITRVDATRDGGWWDIGFDGKGIGIKVADCPMRPTVGQTIRLYGRGLGFAVRGIAIEGRVCYYRTDLEDREQHTIENVKRDMEKVAAFEGSGKAELDAQLAALPEVFRRRLMGFRERKPEFWWRSGPYEMSCCVDAVKIAEACRTSAEIQVFATASWEDQKARVPGLFEGHSGNSFGFACRLAHHYITDPENVVKEHGALCVLVGCDDYGCQYGRKGAQP